MSRVIKFRVWDSHWKQWALPAPQMVPRLFLTETGDFAFSSLSSLTPETAVIEQFTGLLDKNGREIYEGDIVQYRVGSGIDFDSFRTETKAIMFDTQNARFGVGHPESDGPYYLPDSYHRHTLEVVGHVHDRAAFETHFGVAYA